MNRGPGLRLATPAGPDERHEGASYLSSRAPVARPEPAPSSSRVPDLTRPAAHARQGAILPARPGEPPTELSVSWLCARVCLLEAEIVELRNRLAAFYVAGETTDGEW